MTTYLCPDDATICQDLLTKSIKSLRDASLSKFLELFCVLKSKVYASTDLSMKVNRPIPPSKTDESLSFIGQSDPMNGFNISIDPNTEADIVLGSNRLETYLNHVADIFNDDLMDVDDVLTTWYGSVPDDMDEAENIQHVNM